MTTPQYIYIKKKTRDRANSVCMGGGGWRGEIDTIYTRAPKVEEEDKKRGRDDDDDDGGAESLGENLEKGVVGGTT